MHLVTAVLAMCLCWTAMTSAFMGFGRSARASSLIWTSGMLTTLSAAGRLGKDKSSPEIVQVVAASSSTAEVDLDQPVNHYNNVILVAKRSTSHDEHLQKAVLASNRKLVYADSLEAASALSGSGELRSAVLVVDEAAANKGFTKEGWYDVRLANRGSSMSCTVYVIFSDCEDSDKHLGTDYNLARRACRYDYYADLDSNSSTSVSNSNQYWRFSSLLESLHGHAPSAQDTLLDAGEWSHFLSLALPSVDAILEVEEEGEEGGEGRLGPLRQGIDAWELRVDLLKDQSVKSLHRQIALLRDANARLQPTASPHALPIVFTVRSKGQIGMFPDESPDKMFQLLREGLRAGCEWVDVEACWSEERHVHSFTRDARQHYSRTSRLLGSLHVTQTLETDQETEELFMRTSLGGEAHMLKVVTGAVCSDDCDRVHRAGQRVSDSLGVPYIGICLGKEGEGSRVMNKRFTPVTHENMRAAAPGQLTAEQLGYRRLDLALEGATPRNFFLFGNPISQSLSPRMHNSGFRVLGLPHVYKLSESDSVREYFTSGGPLYDKSFGGASVTIPHKETIIPYLSHVHGAARAIGAVNTIVPERRQTPSSHPDRKRDRVLRVVKSSVLSTPSKVVNLLRGRGFQPNKKLIGYNTDWLGIQLPLLQQLRRKGSDITSGHFEFENVNRSEDEDAHPSPVWISLENPRLEILKNENKDNNDDNEDNVVHKDNGVNGVSGVMSSQINGCGLVVGAGGTARAAAYAIKDMGLSLLVYNRSPLRAQELAKSFGGQVVTAAQLSDPKLDLWNHLEVVVSTVPASAQFSFPVSGAFGDTLLSSNNPIVLDAVYKPANTDLLIQAKEEGCLVVQGATMLLEQGIQQFELWTQRRAPRAEMEAAVFEGVERVQ